MSVWQTRHRLLSEQLQYLLHGNPTEEDEEVVRVLIAAGVLLAQHQVDKRGRCRYCYDSTWPRRRKPCTVHQTFAVALNQPIKMVLDWFKDHQAGGQVS